MHNEELRKALGRKIKDAREAKGWTIYELSKRSGLGETHIKSIENGVYSMRVDILDKLCRTLEIKVIIPTK